MTPPRKECKRLLALLAEKEGKRLANQTTYKDAKEARVLRRKSWMKSRDLRTPHGF
jgi:hypothetical protein